MSRRVLSGLGEPAAVLFDLDGTLVDSAAAVNRAWTRVSREYGTDLDETLRVHAGRSAIDTLRLVAPWLDEATAAHAATALLAWQYDDLADVVANDGCADLLDLLTTTDLPWAVVTSGDRRLAWARLGAANLSPPLVITADDVAESKPAPEGYLLAARRLRVAAQRCLVVEDAPAGVAAGRRAGMRVVGVRGVSADVTVEHLSELADLLRSGTKPCP